MRRFAISDIHGCLNTFKALLSAIGLQPEDELFLLGDYIDRGPDSKGVLDHIFSLLESGFQVFPLRGNHEQSLLRAAETPNEGTIFYRNGGQETLASFGVQLASQIPARYLEFVQSLPYYLEIPDYLLVHAGFRFGPKGPLSYFEEMIYIRDWYLDIDYAWLGSRRIVHGHTPLSKQAIQTQAQQLRAYQYLDIDAGCVYPQYPGRGYLCAFNLDTGEVVFEKNQEREEREEREDVEDVKM
jgi:serine/threonine protein phosphatase 1